MAQTSGTTSFSPSIAELVRVAYSRIQVFAADITIAHMADARMAANLLLSDWAANRGVNLGAVDLITIPLQPGVATYTLPANTIDLLDVYLRTLTLTAGAGINLGRVLIGGPGLSSFRDILGPPGNPLVSQPYGDPLLLQPGSGVLASTAGSQLITMRWPAHGLSVGSAWLWGCPISIGGLAISGFSVVETVLDANTIQFIAPSPALETQTNSGGTPLFSTTAGSATVDCILPGHGLSVGSEFPVEISTTVGGITLFGEYTVAAVINSYEFNFVAAASAGIADSVFENNGQINVVQQVPSVGPIDIPLFPLSRNDYAALSNKSTPGRPTTFWLDRIVPPTFTVWPVPPEGSFYSFAAYRMREFQDANPVNGQGIDAPRRMWRAFVAALTADLAEIYQPAMWAAKVQAAETAWSRASAADVERATTRILPLFQAYYR